MRVVPLTNNSQKYLKERFVSIILRLDVQVRVFLAVFSLYLCLEHFPELFETLGYVLPIKAEMTFKFLSGICFVAMYLMMFYLPIYFWNRPIVHPGNRSD